MTTRSTNGRTTPRKTKVGIDLDKIDNEATDKAPFTFRHGGKEWTLGSAQDMDFFDIVEYGSSPAGQAVLICKLLGDQLEEFRAVGPIPARKINALMDAYQEHYGLPSPGEASALPTS
jgi:hypothetical protein